MFKKAASHLGIPKDLKDFIDFLFSFSPEQDWAEGARPIVWPSNDLIMHEYEISLSTTKRLINAALRFGLIHTKDSPNGKRFGRRTKEGNQGRIVYAYGFDLSPLAVRYDEFEEIVEARRAAREARRHSRRGLTVVYRKLLNSIERAQSLDLSGDWRAIDAEAHDLFERGALGIYAEQIDPFLQALTLRLDDIETRLFEAVEQAQACGQKTYGDVGMNPRGSESGPHNTTTNHRSSDESDKPKMNPPSGGYVLADSDRPHGRNGQTNFALQESMGLRSETAREKPPLPDRAFAPEETFTAKHLIEISGGIAMKLHDTRPTWHAVVEAAYYVKNEFGISQHAWGTACAELGRERAAACIAIIDAKRSEIKSPGGYLRGLTKKAQDGKLNLSATIYLIKKGTYDA